VWDQAHNLLFYSEEESLLKNMNADFWEPGFPDFFLCFFPPCVHFYQLLFSLSRLSGAGSKTQAAAQGSRGPPVEA
jgi:hypothetical protein